MTHPVSIHHINFIVKDLEESVSAYRRMLRLGPFTYDALPKRGVRTARINLGGTWLVLVSPSRLDSVPGQFLKSNGEGFFLLSFGVNDLDAALAYYEDNGAITPGANIRQGLQDWRVIDLKTEDALGAVFHLTDLKNADD